MKTRLEVPAHGGPLRVDGRIKLRDPRLDDVVTRAFESILSLGARRALGAAPGGGTFRWTGPHAGASSLGFKLALDGVPSGFWRVLCGMLEARGVESLELRSDALWSTEDAIVSRVAARPDALSFGFAVDSNPNVLRDRYVHLRFAVPLGNALVDRIAAHLDDWHEALWGGFCDSADRYVPPFESLYLLDPQTVVSHLDPWTSDDDAWHVLARVARNIDEVCAPLVTVHVE